MNRTCHPFPPDTTEAPVTACIIHLDYKEEQNACLTREERDQGDRFCFEEDRQRHLASHAALRMILGRELGLAPSAVPIRSRQNGKPFLPDHQLHFNLSHSRGLALVAFSPDCELGVDVEFIRPLPDLEHLARRNFAPSEIDWILSHPPPQRQNAFFKLWACKEAWLKGIGTGIARGLDSFSVSFTSSGAILSVPTNTAEEQAWSIHPLKIDVPNYAAALAVQTTSPKIELKTWFPGPSGRSGSGETKR